MANLNPQAYNAQPGTAKAQPTAGPQLTEYDMTRLAIREAKKYQVFTPLGANTKVRRNHGDTFKKMRRYPVLDDRNVNNEGIGGDGTQLIPGKWYSIDANGALTEHADKATAEATGNKIMSGNGNLYGGSRDFAIQNGAIPTLRETGGRVNVVGSTRTIIQAKIRPYSISTEFTRQEMELGEANVKVEKTMEIARAYAEVSEMMTRNALLNQGLVNGIYCGTATSMDTVDAGAQLTYDDMRRFQQHLDLTHVAIDTTFITGSVNIDTKVVESGRYVYIPIEAERSVEGIKDDGDKMFKSVATYAGARSAGSINDRDANKQYLSGEIGSIGKFRIISTADMPHFSGKGAAIVGADVKGKKGGGADGAVDAGTADAGLATTNGKYDVFPMLSIGSGSFETLTLAGDTVKVQYAAPQMIARLDNTGEIGVVSVRWYWGILFNKPEQINCLLFSAKK